MTDTDLGDFDSFGREDAGDGSDASDAEAAPASAESTVDRIETTGEVEPAGDEAEAVDQKFTALEV